LQVKNTITGLLRSEKILAHEYLRMRQGEHLPDSLRRVDSTTELNILYSCLAQGLESHALFRKRASVATAIGLPQQACFLKAPSSIVIACFLKVQGVFFCHLREFDALMRQKIRQAVASAARMLSGILALKSAAQCFGMQPKGTYKVRTPCFAPCRCK
jgi:hypothetical protein